ncbi:MAG TPA: hypothetical protein VFW73_11890 [Lacipirellulaceae bacterium]|nr:hypothetical protein [Lacipirellulaceae bacterium]
MMGPMRLPTIMFLCLFAFVSSVVRGEGDQLYGVHWWDYPYPNAGAGPDGGWSVEDIVTNSVTWWQAPYFVPLYQQITGVHNAAIITRLDYDWDQTVPAPSTTSPQNWANTILTDVIGQVGPYVHRWIIGNEPNLISSGNGWSANEITPADYAQVYSAVRSAIKLVRPQDEVLFAPASPGGVIDGVRWEDGNQWLSEAIDATLALPGGAIDGFALHAYGGQATAADSVAEFHDTYTSQLAIIDSHPVLRDTTAYITEWNRATSTSGDLAANEQVSADFLAQSLLDVNAWNQTPGNHNIRGMAWFAYNKDYGDWNQYSIEWWQTQGNPVGSSGDLWTALMNSSSLPAGLVGTRPGVPEPASLVLVLLSMNVCACARGRIPRDSHRGSQRA